MHTTLKVAEPPSSVLTGGGRGTSGATGGSAPSWLDRGERRTPLALDGAISAVCGSPPRSLDRRAEVLSESPPPRSVAAYCPALARSLSHGVVAAIRDTRSKREEYGPKEQQEVIGCSLSEYSLTQPIGASGALTAMQTSPRNGKLRCKLALQTQFILARCVR